MRSASFGVFIIVIFFMQACEFWTGNINSLERRPSKEANPFYSDQILDESCKEVLKLAPENFVQRISNINERFLASHNQIRKLYDLSDLTWDDDLAKYAQDWANYLKTHNQCLMKHRSFSGKTEGKIYGENLAWSWTSLSVPAGKYFSSPEFAVNMFASECKDYHYDTNSCKPGKICGHFTQVLWADSKRLGCGVAICDGQQNNYNEGRAEIWVCNYDPPGNYIGEWPF